MALASSALMLTPIGRGKYNLMKINSKYQYLRGLEEGKGKKTKIFSLKIFWKKLERKTENFWKRVFENNLVFFFK